MPKILITSYVNPDSDGICCGLVLQQYYRDLLKDAEFKYAGEMNSESKFILRTLKMPQPLALSEGEPFTEITLVDTHHTAQLPGWLPLADVTNIIDHHPGGNEAAFPNAHIQNEAVGAGATLVAERLIAEGLEISPQTASLLCCAIISNTLNFTNPATTDRDKDAFEKLISIAQLPTTIAQDMFENGYSYSGEDTSALVSRHAKVFELGDRRYCLAQIESIDIDDILGREDWPSALEALKLALTADEALVNIIDILKAESWLISQDRHLQQVLTKELHSQWYGGVARVGRVLLRKTDLVPALERTAT